VFTHSHKPLVLPTGPEHTNTHWKQTVFYLRDPITCKEGEKIYGELRCSPNKDNHRDLDIDIAVKFDGEHTKMDVKHEYKLR
jgi:protein arginine N-methyltransferase 1